MRFVIDGQAIKSNINHTHRVLIVSLKMISRFVRNFLINRHFYQNCRSKLSMSACSINAPSSIPKKFFTDFFADKALLAVLDSRLLAFACSALNMILSLEVSNHASPRIVNPCDRHHNPSFSQAAIPFVKELRAEELQLSSWCTGRRRG